MVRGHAKARSSQSSIRMVDPRSIRRLESAVPVLGAQCSVFGA